MDQSLVHMNFLHKFVWTNGPESSPALALVHGWLFPEYRWDFPEEIPEKFWKDPGNALRLRAFPGIPIESTAVCAGIPQTL